MVIKIIIFALLLHAAFTEYRFGKVGKAFHEIGGFMEAMNQGFTKTADFINDLCSRMQDAVKKVEEGKQDGSNNLN